MSDQVDATDAGEIILEGAAEVAEGVAQMARGFSGLALSGAFVVGAGLGGAVAYFVTKRRLETKYVDLAEEEIAQMRKYYHAKEIARENDDKPNLADIVRENGYANGQPEPTQPPMAVAPPERVVEAASATSEDDEVEPEPSEEDYAEQPQAEVRNIFSDQPPHEDHWDHHKELSRRSPLKPYVIHFDERQEHAAYDSVTFTYYEGDDVLCNERDEILPEGERDKLLGEENLSKFGHGSKDPVIVYIRNDQLEMDIEVVKSPNSYTQEVAGFDPPEIRHSDRRRGRARFDDE